jgi:hypothetical protein
VELRAELRVDLRGDVAFGGGGLLRGGGVPVRNALE